MSQMREREASSSGEAPPGRSDVLVVGAGLGEGGLEALRELIDGLGEGEPVCIVAVPGGQAPPEGPDLELLRGRAAMPVELVEAIAPIRGGKVLLTPRNAVVTLRDGVVEVASPAVPGGCAPVDTFLRSLAEGCGSGCVGVVLSGAGTDGTLGLKSIAEGGGMAIAQDPATATFEAMPRNAIASGVVDHVLSPMAIGREIEAYARHLRELSGGDASPEAQREDVERHVEAIADVLRRERDHDFRHYRTTTLVRRILRRMQVLRVARAAAYLRLLEENEEERGALFRELLIGVTAFFRDPGAFESLSRLVVPEIVGQAPPGGNIRVWCPGCATGEEAYSLAMLFLEEIDRQRVQAGVQVFATDIDERALAIARRGEYPLSDAENISAERVERFLQRKAGGLHVRAELRDSVLFSVHNLISDAPFSRMDLISCRNLLIYFGPHLQRKLIPVFHYALRPGGYLFLGPSESIESHAELFVPLDSRHRISQRRHSGADSRRSLALLESRRPSVQPLAPAASPEPDIGQISQRMILDEFAPAHAVVSEDSRVVYLARGVGRYLEPPEGAFDSNLVRMAKDGLRIGLRAALAEAAKTRRRTTRENLSLRCNGRVQPVTVTVQPMPSLGEERSLFLVVFEDRGTALATPDAGGEGGGEAERVIAQLEAELTGTRDDLESAVQELEAANEELKSSNEELLSMNEELQAANEELETSKEELEAGAAALARANADIENLLASTRIATVFLDDELRINSFTSAAREVYNLIESDRGRPILDITNKAVEMPPLPDPSSVADATEPIEEEIRLHDGRWYRRRVLPYRNAEGRSEGMVVTFVDVTALKRSEQAVRESELRMRRIADALPVLIAHCDREERYVFCNREYESWFGIGCDDMIGRTVREVVGEEAYAMLRDPIDRAMGGERVAMEMRLPYACGGMRDVLVEYVPDKRTDGSVHGYYALVQDITGRRRAERRLAAEHAVTRVLAEFGAMAEAAPRLVETFRLAKETSICELWLPQEDGTLACAASSSEDDPHLADFAASFEGVRIAQGEGILGEAWAGARLVVVEDVAAQLVEPFAGAARRAGLRAAVAFPILSGGRSIGVMAYYLREELYVDDSLREMAESIGRDVGQLIEGERAEQARRESEARFQTMADAAPVLIWIAGADKGCTWFNRGWTDFTGRTLEEAVGDGWAVGVHPDDVERRLEVYSSAFDRRDRFRVEYRLRHRSGAYRWVLDEGQPLFTPSGEFAGYVGACIDIHDRREAERATRLLAESGAALSSSLESERTLSAVADLLVPGLADWCAIELIDESGELDVAVLRHADADRSRLVQDLRSRFGVSERSPLRRVLESGESLLMHEVGPAELELSAVNDEHLRLLEGLKLTSALITPLRVAGRSIGCMTLASSGGRRFHESDVPLAEEIARRCAAAIENSRLYVEVQRALRERGEALEQHRAMEQRLGVLVEASSELLVAPDVEGTIEGILGVAGRLVEADATAVWRYDPAQDAWRVVGSRGLSESFLADSTIAGGGDADLPHDPLVIEAETIDERGHALLGERFEFYQREGIRSLLICPMRIRGRVSGTIVFYYQRPHRFSDIEVRAATALANLGGSAVTNAELFASAEHEISERERAEGEAASRAAQQAAVAQLGQFAVREADLDGVLDAACQMVSATLGTEYTKVLELLPGGENLLLRAGVGWREGLVGAGTVDTGKQSQAGYTLRSDEPVIVHDLSQEHRFNGPQLLVEHGVISGLSCVIAGDEGRRWGVLGTHTTRRRDFTRDDVHFLQSVANVLSAAIRAHAGKEALRESEQRFRAVAEMVPDIVWSAGPDLDWTYVNPGFVRLTGMPEQAALGRGWLAAVHEPDLPHVERSLERAVKDAGRYEVELRLRTHDGGHRWLMIRAEPIVEESTGQLLRWYGTCTDIDDIKRAKQQNDLLVGELNHRVKNTMATVLSISDQTARSATTLEEFTQAFEGRMTALSHAHGLLSQTRWRGARLQALLEEVLEPFGGFGQERLRLQGPEVVISPRAALTLTLAIHELATNAAKYGALCEPRGVVDIRWRTQGEEPGELLLEWVERDGPPVRRPERRGFGSRLLERSVAYELGGEVSLDFAPGGVRCSARIPMQKRQGTVEPESSPE